MIVRPPETDIVAEIAADCGHDLSGAQTRAFGLGPRLRWAKAVTIDQRPSDAKAHAARAAAIAAHLLWELA